MSDQAPPLYPDGIHTDVRVPSGRVVELFPQGQGGYLGQGNYASSGISALAKVCVRSEGPIPWGAPGETKIVPGHHSDIVSQGAPISREDRAVIAAELIRRIEAWRDRR